MRIALYMGSFNPIHNGHLALAKHIVLSNEDDELWFVVSPNNPLKDQNELLDEHIRLEMTVLAIEQNNKLKVSDIEFGMPLPSYSIDTLRKLKNEFPQHTFVLLIGSDNALVFDKWKDHEQLLAEFEVLVYPRRGYDFEAVQSLYPTMRKLNTPYYDISSTQIRNAIRNQRPFEQYLPKFVAEFITENQLYL